MPQVPSILLVDDNKTVLDGLTDALAKLLPETEVSIRAWLPTEQDDPEARFAQLTDESTALVVTDYDLTRSGLRGLFGVTLVAWCQARRIPVGDFSRGNIRSLPKEPNLFELRVPPTNDEGAQFIANVFRGFQSIRKSLEEISTLLDTKRSLATVLAAILKREPLDSQFALYMSRFGASNSALVERLTEAHNVHQLDQGVKVQVLTYVLGHVLLNAILKFPGPILSARALAAYMATTGDEEAALHELFKAASYNGPFAGLTHYYWREDVDSKLDELASKLLKVESSDFGDYNRLVVEASLGRSLARHECAREACGGRKGGFLCPFTLRTVCQRADCSVAASGWLPQGAQLSRVEHDFYDEWAPLLGF